MNMVRKFRILEKRYMYPTVLDIFDETVFVIQEFKRWWWIFGKKKWRDFYVDFHDDPCKVDFKELKHAKIYLRELTEWSRKVKELRQ